MVVVEQAVAALLEAVRSVEETADLSYLAAFAVAVAVAVVVAVVVVVAVAVASRDYSLLLPPSLDSVLREAGLESEHPWAVIPVAAPGLRPVGIETHHQRLPYFVLEAVRCWHVASLAVAEAGCFEKRHITYSRWRHQPCHSYLWTQKRSRHP